MSQTIAAFNACKHAIGQLLVRFDRELTADQKSTITRAWSAWTLVDRVGRARAVKIIRDALGDKAKDVIDQLIRFDKEQT